MEYKIVLHFEDGVSPALLCLWVLTCWLMTCFISPSFLLMVSLQGSASLRDDENLKVGIV